MPITKKPKLIKSDFDKQILALVKKSDHKILGTWAADCAKRVLPYFEEKYPRDDRPRKAIEALRRWVKDGVFKMADIRGGSLAAHSAARAVEADDVARSAARSAGQALATAHVPTHSYAASVYAATSVFYKKNSTNAVAKERAWQYKRLLGLRRK